MIKKYINCGFVINKIISCRFATSFFTKGEKKEEIQKSIQPKPQNQIREGARSSFSNLVNKINETNKYFLGVKLNTNYLKVNKVVKYTQIAGLKSDKITKNDIPFEFTKKQNDNSLQVFQKCNQQAAISQKSGQITFSRSRLQAAITQIKSLAKHYIVNIVKKQRLVGVQPNFQIQIIKTFNSLDPKITFQLRNQETQPQVKIKNITLLKGLAVHRNDNYSTDSYEKNEEQIGDGIINYTLYRQQKQQYPETEWFSTKKINARFEVLVKGGPVIDILESGNSIGSTENIVHNVIIETDMVPPPAISLHQLTAEECLRSYRLDYKSLLITNFDRKNQFYPLTYSQNDKKSILVNKIE